MFKTDVVCGFFSTYVQSYIILQSQKKNVRLAKDAPVTQTLFFFKGGRVIQCLSDIAKHRENKDHFFRSISLLVYLFPCSFRKQLV